MKRLMFLVLAVLVGAAVMTAGCTSSSNPSPSAPPQTSTASTNTVRMEALAFHPSSVTIAKGTNVTWTNDDLTTHTVTSDTGAFESGNLSPSKSFTHQFNDTGTFPYHCRIHTFMKGTVTVQ
ncbi:MAG: cupredoxin domain-containing protein [Halobacteriota archaeon]